MVDDFLCGALLNGISALIRRDTRAFSLFLPYEDIIERDIHETAGSKM